jgi:hypothetical protein
MEFRGSNPVAPTTQCNVEPVFFLTPRNGHCLGKRERLFDQIGNFGSNPGTSETRELAKSPVFVGFSNTSINENRETGLAGWRSRIRTRKFPRHGQSLVLYDLKMIGRPSKEP